MAIIDENAYYDGYNGFDYVKDGEIHKHAPIESVMIESDADLALLTGYAPGSIAFTVGYSRMWQLAADGTWTEFPQPEE